MADVPDWWAGAELVAKGEPTISGRECSTIIYDELNPHPEPAKAMRPDWLGVGKSEDTVPWDDCAMWTCLVVYDADNHVWVRRTKGNHELCISCEDVDAPPRDAERIALMFLVFAEEEEALNES